MRSGSWKMTKTEKTNEHEKLQCKIRFGKKGKMKL